MKKEIEQALKQEIIDELNEHTSLSWYYVTDCFETYEREPCNQKDSLYCIKMFRKNEYWENELYVFLDDMYMPIPLKLAHKITTYFMRLENENE